MISVIVLHHDKAEYSRACLHSLLVSDARPLEIINVDNGSRDDTARVLDEWETRAQKLKIETQRLNFDSNVGAIVGRNAAMKIARGGHFVFLDNDIFIFQRHWLEKLRDFLDEDEKRAVVAPKLLFPFEPFSIECCGAAVSPRGRVEYLGRGAARDSIINPREIQCAISAAWMMTRKIYELLGGLDEIYSPVQYEDLDFCYRAREKKFQVWTLPSVEVFHFEHTTTAGSGDINFKYVTAKNSLTFKKRWSTHFARENATTEESAQWKTLEKRGIGEIDWCALVEKVQ